MSGLPKIKELFSDKLSETMTLKDIEGLRVEFLGKNGLVQEQMKKIAALPIEEKKSFGAEVNQVKDFIGNALEEKSSVLEKAALQQKLDSEIIDVTLPARRFKVGKIHPLSQTIIEVKDIFSRLGFKAIEGPEIDDEWHNFTALNMPEHHPARQMHDTFYLEDGNLLRTHTSNMQIRYMEQNRPPYKIVSIGKVYRSDYDATHTPMFHQVEGLYIDKDITMAHLKWCLETFLSLFFGVDNMPIRMRPSFFPFTEPSVEVDMRCDRSKKGEIRLGEGSDWIEILGAGMVHPNVLKNVKVDAGLYQGFAFGAGIERLTMLKYGIPDLRNLFEGDIRWLRHYGC